jgi:ABC-type dipeptide/oligopeptide/nickel transport system permease subunit
MTTALTPEITARPVAFEAAAPPETIWREVLRSRRVIVGGGILLAMTLLCIFTLPWTLSTRDAGGVETGIPRYQATSDATRIPPHFSRQINGVWRIAPEAWFGTDNLGRSVLARSLVGGTISLAVGFAAATIAVLLGLAIGLVSGFRGGWVDAVLMRTVDIMYGLPYVLLVILFKIALERPLTEGISRRAIWILLFSIVAVGFLVWVIVRNTNWALIAAGLLLLTLDVNLWIYHANAVPSTIAFRMSPQTANLVVLFSAIGLVSWLTMARVVRGQVLSLRGQPFIEACRAMGLKQRRIFLHHILPNLVGPITVYATLTVPSAILQESFLSFLGVGVNDPLPTWGSLASEGVQQLSPLRFYWWLLLYPCALLAITLLSLNFLGDGLRDVFDPKKEAAKI